MIISESAPGPNRKASAIAYGHLKLLFVLILQSPPSAYPPSMPRSPGIGQDTGSSCSSPPDLRTGLDGTSCQPRTQAHDTGPSRPSSPGPRQSRSIRNYASSFSPPRIAPQPPDEPKDQAHRLEHCIPQQPVTSTHKSFSARARNPYTLNPATLSLITISAAV